MLRVTMGPSSRMASIIFLAACDSVCDKRYPIVGLSI